MSVVQAGHSMPPRLVAVSKGQTVDLVQEAYSYGIRHFGENYVSVHTYYLLHQSYPVTTIFFDRCQSYKVKLES